MDDFDLVVINAYLNLAKGDIASGLKELRYKKQFIEEKVRADTGRAFPVDLILFSRHYNHAFLIEIKDTSSSDFNESQADGYDNLSHISLRQTLPDNSELENIKIDVAYHGHNDNEAELSAGLDSCGVEFPLLVFDHQDMKIRRSEQAGDFDFSRIKNLYSSPVNLNVDDIDKIIPYVKFSNETDNHKVAKIIVPALIEMVEPANEPGTSTEVSIEELTKETYSLIDIWSNLNSEYRNNLVRKVRDALVQLRDNGLDNYIAIHDERRASLSIFDLNGEINQATLNAIKQRVDEAGPQLSTNQTTLV